MSKGFRLFTRRILIALLLLGIVLSPYANEMVLASPTNQGAEPQSPGAPGEHLVTNVNLTPDSPNILRNNQNVNLTFEYITNQPGGVRIFFRPFTNGALSPGYAAHASILYPTGSGQGSGYFTITSGQVVVDQISVQMWNANQTTLLFEAFLPVYYLFSDSIHTVTNLALTPDTPDVLALNQDVDITFDYTTRQVGGVRIWARPFTNGQLTPSYAAHASPLYPTGGEVDQGTSPSPVVR